MVQFAPSAPSLPVHSTPFQAWTLLVRERVPLTDHYGLRDEGRPGHGTPAGPSCDPTAQISERSVHPEAPVPSSSVDACSPTPDPFDDADALEALEDEIAVLAAHIHAATHRLLTLIADFDRRRGWELGGHRSCAHWLSFRTGIDLGAAREKVRAARALTGLPKTSASMARGELSFSQVRALSRVATPANEEDLLELAKGCCTAQLERMIRAFRRGSREDEATREERCHQMRALSVFPDEEGMYVVKGRLPAEVGAVLLRAVEAASHVLFREESGQGPMTEGERGPKTDSQLAASQRRADALGLCAERALAAGFGHGSEPAPISGTRAERFQVMLHVEPETLEEPTGEETDTGGRSELEDGTRVSAETSRRLACDAGLVRISHASDGSVFHAGRKTRTIPPALRRALEARDQGCRFPGCGLRFTDGHHVKHWADGGETTLDNLVLLCRHHHRLGHEGGWTVGWWGRGRPVFFDLRGGTRFDGRWRPGEDAEAESRREGASGGDELVAALIQANQSRGVEPNATTASTRWKREEDIPDPVHFRALEALGTAMA